MRQCRRIVIISAAMLCFAHSSIRAEPAHPKLTEPLEATKIKGKSFTPVINHQSEDGLSVSLASHPKLGLKKLSEILVTVDVSKLQGKDFELQSLDAQMPEHKHGMMTKASKPERLESSDKDKRLYLVKGIKLHMPGFWLFQLNYKIEQESRTLKLRYDLPL